jgi:hypothetical protein
MREQRRQLVVELEVPGQVVLMPRARHGWRWIGRSGCWLPQIKPPIELPVTLSGARGCWSLFTYRSLQLAAAAVERRWGKGEVCKQGSYSFVECDRVCWGKGSGLRRWMGGWLGGLANKGSD